MSAHARATRSERPRRLLNFVAAVVALVVSLPFWAVIAIAIKLTSRGPVFYKQLRVGLDARSTLARRGDPRRKRDLGGRPFQIYKFRTMVVDAELRTGPVWSARGDCRVTPVGRVLRRCRLDELPQLINVIKGDMNVVGPRPERPSFFAELREQIPNYQLRQRVRPGITGYAQITFEADASLEDVGRKVKYDLEYLERANVWTDLRIMLMTVPVLAFRGSLLVPTSRKDAPSITPVPVRGARLPVFAVEVQPEPGLVPFAARNDVDADHVSGLHA